MYVLNGAAGELGGWIRAEIELERDISAGQRGSAVKRVQEWLTFHGFGVAIDSDFGNVTMRAVQRFQDHVALPATGIVDQKTFGRLVEPMKRALSLKAVAGPARLEEAAISYARGHLAQHPVEIGGPNRGPWVRLYMKGKDGVDSKWCAGFVTFVIHQAAESLKVALPIEGSFSCDTLAAQGRTAGVFLPERDATPGTVRPGSIFLVRRTATDWTHTGLVVDPAATAFDTVEGNTNDDGHREGFEVCSLSRGYRDKDFIRLSA